MEEYKSGWQRALADYKNLQREVEQRRSEWAQMSEQQILEEFVPVYDNFKKAMACDTDMRINADDADNTDKRFENWRIGVDHIKKQFAEVLKQHGVEEIKTVGEKFDPNLHEAGGEEEVEGVESGMIVKEIVGGYKMGERVIRAARVIIAK
jgi:molecular chaperone GrpE